jgi:hypothetical protein
LREGVNGAKNPSGEGMRFHAPELSGRTEREASILQYDLLTY